jgi:hypothetical protein
MPTPLPLPPHAGLPVRYYPRRIRRPVPPPLLSPSQALHLANDQARAERAGHTAGHRYFVPPAEPPGPTGRLRRLLHRLLGRPSHGQTG